MTNVNKIETKKALKVKMERLELSGNRVSDLIGISSANVSHILTGKAIEMPSMISDAIWFKVYNWVYSTQGSSWKTAETLSYKKIFNICRHSQDDGLSRAISHRPGSGKSFSLRAYADSVPNVFYIEGEEYFTKKTFLKEAMRVMGVQHSPYITISDMVDRIILHLNTLNKPLIIIDEADKLRDGVLNFFKTFYNKTNSGFVLCGAPYFKQRIDKGVRLQKQCYEEIFSRIGGCFLTLPSLRMEDVRLICNTNGITDESQITEAYNYAEGDLRRIKMSVDSFTKDIKNHKKQTHEPLN